MQEGERCKCRRVTGWTGLGASAVGVVLLAVLLRIAYDTAVRRSWDRLRATDRRNVILVTGGAGYIGSHTVVELLALGEDVVVLDNLSRGKAEAVKRVSALAEKAGYNATAEFRHVDLRDEAAVGKVFRDFRVTACLHFAGYKAVGESVGSPLDYYENNLASTITLLRVMERFGVHALIFSSSATVYSAGSTMPVSESASVGSGISSPYGRTKFFIEQILIDVQRANTRWNIVALRYFNPVGAHPSGLIGEDPEGVPNNLMPFVAHVAVGRFPRLVVFGDDYDTPDGTCIRDYLHVVDLASGHLRALELLRREQVDWLPINLGTGRGYSVLDMVKAFEQATGREIPFEVGPRRRGDIPILYANASLAAQRLGWRASRALDEMVTDLWNWQQNNPLGYSLASKQGH